MTTWPLGARARNSVQRSSVSCAETDASGRPRTVKTGPAATMARSSGTIDGGSTHRRCRGRAGCRRRRRCSSARAGPRVRRCRCLPSRVHADSFGRTVSPRHGIIAAMPKLPSRSTICAATPSRARSSSRRRSRARSTSSASCRPIRSAPGTRAGPDPAPPRRRLPRRRPRAPLRTAEDRGRRSSSTTASCRAAIWR